MSINSNFGVTEATAFNMASADARIRNADDASLPNGWWIIPAALSGIGFWVMIARLLIG